jgi:putative transposase
MKKTKFTEGQIIGILKEQEAGKKVAEICRSHGISQPTFYGWKSKYSGLEVNQVKRMKELEAELSQYKKIVAEQTLHITVLKDVLKKSYRAC